jgi:hypothetical protein
MWAKKKDYLHYICNKFIYINIANIKFRLNNGSKTIITKQYSIYLRYKFGRQVDLKKSIGFKIYPNQWDDNNQKVRNRSEILNRAKINTLIQNLTRHFEDFEDSLISKGEKPTKIIATNHFKNFFNDSTEINKPQNLLTFINDYRLCIMI